MDNDTTDQLNKLRDIVADVVDTLISDARSHGRRGTADHLSECLGKLNDMADELATPPADDAAGADAGPDQLWYAVQDGRLVKLVMGSMTRAFFAPTHQRAHQVAEAINAAMRACHAPEPDPPAPAAGEAVERPEGCPADATHISRDGDAAYRIPGQFESSYDCSLALTTGGFSDWYAGSHASPVHSIRPLKPAAPTPEDIEDYADIESIGDVVAQAVRDWKAGQLTTEDGDPVGLYDLLKGTGEENAKHIASLADFVAGEAEAATRRNAAMRHPAPTPEAERGAVRVDSKPLTVHRNEEAVHFDGIGWPVSVNGENFGHFVARNYKEADDAVVLIAAYGDARVAAERERVLDAVRSKVRVVQPIGMPSDYRSVFVADVFAGIFVSDEAAQKRTEELRKALTAIDRPAPTGEATK